MFLVDEIKIQSGKVGCVTDSDAPVLAFSLKSDAPDTKLQYANIRIGEWNKRTDKQTDIVLDGLSLAPFKEYTVAVSAYDNHGNSAVKKASFLAGRRNLAWDAKWITDKSYHFSNRKSPAPFTFRKRFDKRNARLRSNGKTFGSFISGGFVCKVAADCESNGNVYLQGRRSGIFAPVYIYGVQIHRYFRYCCQKYRSVCVCALFGL